MNAYNQASIVQPVLQWNREVYPNQWSYQSWAVTPSGAYSSTAYPISQGYNVRGSLTYSSGVWTIETRRTGGSVSTLNISGYIANVSVNPFLVSTLEVGKTTPGDYVNADLPGSCYFWNFTYIKDGRLTPIYWGYVMEHQVPGMSCTFAPSPGNWVQHTVTRQ